MSDREPNPPSDRLRRLWGVALACSGPALIVVSVLIVFHDIAFGGKVPSQHQDIPGYFLPSHCFLGRSLADGTIPGWNPYEMGGVPFAADPQSGWMYLPAMLLYAALPCDVALPAFIVLQPVLAGVGMYWFLRSEGVSRIGATVGGLAIALVLAGSRMGISIHFSGSVAWTAVLLAVLSRYLRAEGWAGRLAWAAVAGVAWSQLAAAHLSHGFAMGSGAALAYLVARGVTDLRGRRRRATTLGLVGVLLVVAVVSVSLGYLAPRIGYLSRANLSLGYDGLRELGAQLQGRPVPPEPTPSFDWSWPLRLLTTPGAYLGAALLVLPFGSWWSRRHRYLAVAFTAYGALSYLLGTPGVARAVGKALGWFPLIDVYLHVATRLRFGIFLAVAVLAPVAIDTWRHAGVGRRLAMLAPGAALWALLPVITGVAVPGFLLFGAGAAVSAVILAAAAIYPPSWVLLPLFVASELAAHALAGQAAPAPVRLRGDVSKDWNGMLVNVVEPHVEAARYLRPGPAMRFLASRPERYLTLEPERAGGAGRGPVTHRPSPTLFGAEDTEGYNPVQVLRYWTFVRAVGDRPVKYNHAQVPDVSPALDVLQVGWNVHTEEGSAPKGRPVVEQGRRRVYPRPAPPRASLVTDWIVASSDREALRWVADRRVDLSERVVLEEDPGLAPDGRDDGAASVDYRPLGTQAARVNVRTEVPGILIIRNVHDPGWRATVDGRPAEVVHADYLLQGIPLGRGRHVVLLTYTDPSIGLGLAGSGIALAALLIPALALRVRSRRRSGREGDRDGSSAQPERPGG